MKLKKSYKTSRAPFLLFMIFLLTGCALTLIRQRTVEAQSCPTGDPCAGDPCCGVVGCTPSEIACLAAGWVWDGACSQPIGNSAACDEVGKFWNFTSGVCQDDPPTVLTCQTFGAYWNYTINTCGSEPAIGNCGGGPDWSNYFSSGCWTGLGLHGGSFCDRSTAFKNQCYGFDGDYDQQYCICTGCGGCGGSPILIDVAGGGFEMTDVEHGVRFDLNAIGGPDRISWTSRTSTASWLVLDGNRDGTISNGRELFGNFSFQTEPPRGVEKNGFRALAEWDKPENGGNGDSSITQDDDVFHKLRLWRDANQNGISDAGELRGLWEFGLRAISLDYRRSRRRDQYGNEFRYRAKVSGADGTNISRWAWDVYLVGDR